MPPSSQAESGLDVNDGNKLEAAFARLEGVVTTEIKHLSHDVKNINQKLDAYPTHRDLGAVVTRVESLEEKTTWNYRAGISFALTLTGGLIVAYFKFSH
jgi:outer membrane receptor for monomeric catechols